AIFPEAAVQGVETGLWLHLDKPLCNIAAHIDTCDLIAFAFQRGRNRSTGVETDLALRRPAAHEDGDVPKGTLWRLSDHLVPAILACQEPNPVSGPLLLAQKLFGRIADA